MKTKSMKNFWIIFAGQFVSMLGSGISAFGLSIWVLLKTDSATLFTLTAFAGMLPNVILSPITGSVADRYDRKKIIILCDSLDALLKLVILALFFLDSFEIWMLVIFSFLSSSLGAFQQPAFAASIPVIVDKKDLEKANSMIGLSYSIKTLLVPVMAGFLYSLIGIKALFLIDFVTYFAAIITMLPQDLKHKILEKTGEGFLKTVKSDFVFTIEYLKNMGVFFKILYLITAINLVYSFAIVLLGPLVMSNYDSKIFGIVDASVGFGMVAGAILTNFIASKDKMKSIYLGVVISGFFLIGVSISPKWYFIGLALFLSTLPMPRVNAIFGALVQRKVASKMLGKISATMSAIANLFTPFAILLSGVFADYVFNPLLVEGGALSNTIVGTIVGVGEARGIAFMFLLSGLIVLLLGIIALSNKDMRSFDRDCPDVLE